MRRKRTIYFNDARHYYLFVHEPPMRMEDAWAAIDEVAGTAVDTFIYGVARGDGLFYPSKKGLRFGADKDSFDMAAYWRAWENMQSLIDRGLDPLRVLVDRAHDKDMEFFASLRMGDLPGLDPEHKVSGGGAGYAQPEARDHQLAVLEELATEYPVEGVELDFAGAPGGTMWWFKEEEMAEHTSTMTEYMRRIAETVRGRPGEPGQLGARVYPTEELNRRTGLDVRTWLQEGLVDWVAPMMYVSFVLDANVPIDWLTEAAHEHDVSVYGVLQPYYADSSRQFRPTCNATPEMMRAASANYWQKGADGLYSYFLKWPLGLDERASLTELGDPELGKEGNKHYFLRRKCDGAEDYDYPSSLPLEISRDDLGRRHAIPFEIADDPGNDRVRAVVLSLDITNLVSDDRIDVWLNGTSLAAEACKRSTSGTFDPYIGLRLEFHLEQVRPQQGANQLELALQWRPENMVGGVTLEDVEIRVEYDSYPARPGG